MIQLDDLGMRYPEVGWVFQHVNWSLARGRSAVLVGPSGAGKTTLLRLLAGLEEPTTGKMRVDSAKKGMLFQKNALFDSLTVEENLLFPLRERLGIEGAEARARAKESLRAVSLPGTEALFPIDLSGGMQKRLGIARALIVEPELILYDDPTAGLDPITSRSITQLLRELGRGRDVTSVIVTNDVDRAPEMGDEINLIARGQWIAGGPSDKIRQNPNPSIRQFFSGAPEGPLTVPLDHATDAEVAP